MAGIYLHVTSRKAFMRRSLHYAVLKVSMSVNGQRHIQSIVPSESTPSDHLL